MSRQIRLFPLLLAAAALIHIALAVGSGGRNAMTYDELAHLTAGYSYVTTGDYRLQPENGWLPQTLIGLGLKAGGIAPPDFTGPLWDRSDVWSLGRQWIASNQVDLDRLLFWGRLPVSLLGGMLVVLIGLSARRTFGVGAGLTSAGAAAFCPTLVAHASLATSDIAGGLGLLLFTLAFARMTRRLTLATVGLAGLSAGVLALAKFSMLLAAPIALVLLTARVASGRPMTLRVPGIIATRLRRRVGTASALIVATTMVLMIAAGLVQLAFVSQPGVTTPDSFSYYFPETLLAERTPQAVSWIDGMSNTGLLPGPYANGLKVTLAMSTARPAFFNGKLSPDGFTWFFPYAALVKTTLGLLAGLGLATYTVATDPRRQRWLRRLLPLVTLAGVYAAASATSNLNIGHRHLLPLYPPALVLLGALAAWPQAKSAWRRLLAPAAAGAMAVECLLIWPHALAYFNPLHGGPSQAYRHLVDSSLDWGQALGSLADAVERARGPEDAHLPVYLSYFGNVEPSWYGLDVRPLCSSSELDFKEPPLAQLEPGLYAVSATRLQNVYVQNQRAWSRQNESRYRGLGALIQEIASVRNDPTALASISERIGGDTRVNRAIDTFHTLRFIRLTQYLRLLEPDSQAAYAINIYRLNAEQLAIALDGPPAAWFDTQGRFAPPPPRLEPKGR